MDLDRDLLFGLLALQNGLVGQDRLVEAIRAWRGDQARPLADHLVDRRDLDAEDRAVVEALVARHLERHGGDATMSLASLPVDRSVRGKIDTLSDPGLTAVLSRAGSDAGATESGSGNAAPESVGAGTAEGRRFRVLRPHARGGLGAVFAALDGELNREVALKQILDHHADDPASRQRFLLEAEITGGLEHPGIVPVYGLGLYPDGRPYYAMRFIKGETLKEAIDRFRADASLRSDPGRRSLELRKLLRRFLDVCNAIAYAHSRGVLHRDIKPANVIVGKHGETLVVDWGLARAHGKGDDPVAGEERLLVPSSAGSSVETLPGAAMGTPAFMSPEQARGDLEALGPRSDVYSLGATLYALLVGVPPFRGDHFRSVLEAVQSGEFASPRSLEPSLDPPLDAIVRKAMALRPEDRYESARALSEDLERWLADEPVLAYPEPWTRTLARWLTRHRTAVTATAAAGLVALVGLGTVAAVQTQGRAALAAKNGELEATNRRLVEANRREAEARSLADANAGAARRAESRAEARIDLALGAIDRFREAVDTNLEVKDRPENAGLRRELLRVPQEFYAGLRDDLRSDPESRPEARLRLAETMRRLGRLNGQLGSAAAAIEQLRASADLLAEAAADPNAPAGVRLRARDRRLEVLGDLANERRAQGDAPGAKADLAVGVSEARDQVAARPDDPQAHRALARLLESEGYLALTQGATAETLARAGEALTVIARVLAIAPDDPETLKLAGIVRFALEAPALEDLGRYDEALASLETGRSVLGRARSADTAAAGLDQLEASLNARFASVYKATGRDREALLALERVVEARRASLREQPAALSPRRDLAIALLDLAGAREDAGQLEPAGEALGEARRALDALRADFPRSYTVLTGLGRAASIAGRLAYRGGRYEDAVAAFREVSAFAEAAMAAEQGTPGPAARANLAGNEYNIGILLDNLGRPDEALAAYDRSEAIRRRLVADFPDQPTYRLDLAHTLANRANIRNQAGRDLPDVLRDYREAVATLASLADAFPKSAVVADSLARNVSNFCSVLQSDLRFAEAEARAQAVAPILERRVAAQPDLLQPQLDLSFNDYARADALALMGRVAEARRLHRDAIALLGRVVERGKDRNEGARELALHELNLALMLVEPGEAEEAAALADRSAGRLEALRAAGRLDATTARRLDRALRTLARRLAMLGRAAEADAAWARADALEEPPAGRLELRAWAGDLAGFLAATDAPPDDRLVDLAAAASLASRRAGDAPEAAALAARAVAWLGRARDLGAFAPGYDRTVLFRPDFAPLADRPDFRALLLDVTFPADPFEEPSTGR